MLTGRGMADGGKLLNKEKVKVAQGMVKAGFQIIQTLPETTPATTQETTQETHPEMDSTINSQIDLEMMNTGQ